MNPGDKLYTVLFPIDSADAQQGEATVVRVTEKRIYLDHKVLPIHGPFEARAFSLRQVNYLPLFEGRVEGGYCSPLVAIRSALVSLHEEAGKLRSKLELNARRLVRMEELRTALLDKEAGPEVEILPPTKARSTRCQATVGPSAEAAQCLLAIGHDGDHDFRLDTAAVWADAAPRIIPAPPMPQMPVDAALASALVCPACKQQPKLTTDAADAASVPMSQIFRVGCGCGWGSTSTKSSDDAIRLWNTRMQEAGSERDVFPPCKPCPSCGGLPELHIQYKEEVQLGALTSEGKPVAWELSCSCGKGGVVSLVSCADAVLLWNAHVQASVKKGELP
jgi:hypothetical protein